MQPTAIHSIHTINKPKRVPDNISGEVGIIETTGFFGNELVNSFKVDVSRNEYAEVPKVVPKIDSELLATEGFPTINAEYLPLVLVSNFFNAIP